MCLSRRIVVAEDEDADALLLKRALAKAQVNEPVEFAKDGREAIKLLEGHNEEILLLLDLKMPGMDGFEVLRWLREHPGTAQISVVVLSSSTETEDIKRAGSMGVTTYIVKPNDPSELVRILERIKQFWPESAEEPEQTVELAVAA